MRLINTTTLELEDFTLREIPQYAILSHTWGQDEVTFQDMHGRDLPRYFKQGYVKVTMTCRLAAQRGLEYAWIDTCCIDKSSSAELTEAINSMFDYYANSEVCFAHLVDLSPGSFDFRHCRWFTRGWTLQELLAPGTLEFYDQTWTYVGLKSAFVQAIAEATNIVSAAITDPWGTHSYSLATKMSWASRRETTRKEDVSYCLLGIFNVHIPLIYGEGERAFERLLSEIVKQDNDLSILAWDDSRSQQLLERGNELPGMSLLPPSPSYFAGSKDIDRVARQFPELTLTNRGLLITPDVPICVFFPHEPQRIFLGVCVGYTPGNTTSGGTWTYLPLRKIAPGLFCRHGHLPLASFKTSITDLTWTSNSLNYHVVMQRIERSLPSFATSRRHNVHIPTRHGFELIDAIPERLWDPEDRAFLRPVSQSQAFFPMVLAMIFQDKNADSNPVLVLCDNSTGVPSVGVVSEASAYLVMQRLFRGRQREESLIWADFEALGVKVDFARNENVIKSEGGHGLVLEQGTPQDGFPPVRVSLHSRDLESVR